MEGVPLYEGRGASWGQGARRVMQRPPKVTVSMKEWDTIHAEQKRSKLWSYKLDIECRPRHSHRVWIAWLPARPRRPHLRSMSTQFAMTSNPVAMTSNPTGMTSNPVTMTFNPVWITSNPAGMTSNRVTMIFNPVGITSNPAGMSSNPVGMTSNPI